MTGIGRWYAVPRASESRERDGDFRAEGYGLQHVLEFEGSWSPQEWK